MKPDVFDGCIVAGFLAFCLGIWWLSPPWALIIGGAGLLAFGLLMSWQKGGEKR